jgi:hypothetical protein
VMTPEGDIVNYYLNAYTGNIEKWENYILMYLYYK